MTAGLVSVALMQGGYCRSGDTGRGQVWLAGACVGVAGPRLLRFMRQDPLLEQVVLTTKGVPRMVFRMKAQPEEARTGIASSQATSSQG